MRLAIFSLATGFALLATNICDSAEPQGQPVYGQQAPGPQPVPPQAAHPQSTLFRRIGPGSYNKQAAIGAYGRAVYPKYTWGFHSRDLQNIGVPHGDIGTLASGLQRDPW